MKLEDAKRKLDSLLAAFCVAMGFARYSPLIYTRSRHSDEFILFGLRKDARGYFAVTASVGLRFAAITKLVEGSPTNGLHINVPLHLLSSERKFSEWQFCDGAQLEGLLPMIKSELEAKAIPFFDRFGSLAEMRDRLRSISPQDWFTFTGEQRTELLAAVESGLGNDDAAIKILDNALLLLRGALPKKRASLEALRSKLPRQDSNISHE